ncbi:MAG: hypothetical protein ACRC2T_14990 [Thermoguttaceae bacterium]
MKIPFYGKANSVSLANNNNFFKLREERFLHFFEKENSKIGGLGNPGRIHNLIRGLYQFSGCGIIRS